MHGDFGELSMYGFYNGYMGGYYLLKYSNYCDVETPWQPEDEDLGDYEITQETGPDFTTRECMLNYSKLSIIEADDGNEYITLNGNTSYIDYLRFGLYDGYYDNQTDPPSQEEEE